jgi:hypothetical protein
MPELSIAKDVRSPASKDTAQIIREGVRSGAESELYRRITGSDIVYDPNDPSVEQRVQQTVQEAVGKQEYVDAQGKRHSLPRWDSRTQFELFAAGAERMMEVVKGKGK